VDNPLLIQSISQPFEPETEGRIKKECPQQGAFFFYAWLHQLLSGDEANKESVLIKNK
jgi:hypothetical protein